MPITFTIDKEQRLIRASLSGVLTLADVVAYYNAVRAHPEFSAEYNQLCDCSEVELFQISSREMSTLPASVPFVDSSRHALIATKPVVIGMARMFQQWSPDQSKTQVFKDAAEALAWLKKAQG